MGAYAGERTFGGNAAAFEADPAQVSHQPGLQTCRSPATPE